MSTSDLITVEVTDDALILAFHGTEFDHVASGKFRSAALAAVAEHSGLPVIVDLAQIEMLPSLSIGALIQLSAVLRGGGQRLILAGLSPGVRGTLTTCRLDRVFDLYDTRAEALASRGR